MKLFRHNVRSEANHDLGEIREGQKLAVGDAQGHLHIQNIPKLLSGSLRRGNTDTLQTGMREEPRVQNAFCNIIVYFMCTEKLLVSETAKSCFLKLVKEFDKAGRQGEGKHEAGPDEKEAVSQFSLLRCIK